LRNNEQRYREVVESQTELVCRYRPDTALTFVNEAFCRFFKKRREDVIGMRLLQLIHEVFPQRLLPASRQPEPVTFEREVTSGDGERRWQQWIVYPALDGDGRVVEFQAIARDVTERRKAEESLRATHQQVNRLASQLLHAQEEE